MLSSGYHGLKFDSTGRCVESPGQKAIPDGLASPWGAHCLLNRSCFSECQTDSSPPLRIGAVIVRRRSLLASWPANISNVAIMG